MSDFLHEDHFVSFEAFVLLPQALKLVLVHLATVATDHAPFAVLVGLLFLPPLVPLDQLELGAELFVFLLQRCVELDVLIDLQLHLQYLRAELYHLPNGVGVVRQLALVANLFCRFLSQGHLGPRRDRNV